MSKEELLEKRIKCLEKQNSLFIQVIAIFKKDESFFDHNHNVSQTQMNRLWDEIMSTTKIIT